MGFWLGLIELSLSFLIVIVIALLFSLSLPCFCDKVMFYFTLYIHASTFFISPTSFVQRIYVHTKHQTHKTEKSKHI